MHVQLWQCLRKCVNGYQQYHNVWTLLTNQQLWEYCLVRCDNTTTIQHLLSINSCGVLCQSLLTEFLFCVGKYSWTVYLNMWLTPLLQWSASYLNRCKELYKQQLSLDYVSESVTSFAHWSPDTILTIREKTKQDSSFTANFYYSTNICIQIDNSIQTNQSNHANGDTKQGYIPHVSYHNIYIN